MILNIVTIMTFGASTKIKIGKTNSEKGAIDDGRGLFMWKDAN